MSIDRATVTGVTFQNMVVPATGVLPPGTPGYTPEDKTLPFDPEEARRLLAESSYGGPENLPVVQALATQKRIMLVLAVWYGAQTVGGYTLSVVMPTYLIRVTGMSPPDAFTANLVAVLLSGVFVLLGGYVVDRFPLRPVAIIAMAGLALTAVPGLLIIAEFRTVGAAVAGQVLCSIFVAGTHVGGCTELFDAYENGRLATLLDQGGVPLAAHEPFNPYDLMPGWVHPRHRS